ncbi:MAG: PAS-domain containing protein [Rhodospirillales bacterium]
MTDDGNNEANLDVLIESLQHLSQAFTVFDKDLKLVFWNAQYGNLLGFSEDMLYTGAPMETFFRLNAERGYYGDGDIETLVADRVAYVRQEKPHRFQRRLQDGRILDVVGNPLPNGGVVTTYMDVTEQMRLKDRLSEAQKRHELASRISHTGYWKHDLEPHSIFWSDEVYRIHGLPVGQPLSDEKVLDTFHPDDREDVRSLVAAAVERQIPFEFEKRIRRPDGEIRYCHCRGFCENGPDGKLVAIFGTCQDVTTRVLAETGKQESDRRYQLLYKYSPVMLWTVGPDFGLKEFNETFVSQLGYTSDEVIGRNVLDFCSEATKKKVIEQLRPVLLADGQYASQQVEFVRRDGSILEVEVTAYLDRYGPGDQFQTLSAALDISSRNEAERRLRKALEEAEFANRTKSQFLANISHELRTPLNSIIGFSQFMSQQLLGPVGNPQYLEYSRDILYSGEHLLNLINDILDITKIEAGETRIEESTFSIADLVEACMRIVRQRARTKGLVLRVEDIRSGGIMVRADERLMKQVLINLVTNAIKFTEAGEVAVATGIDDGSPWFEVRDTGIGIPPEDIERVMQPFVQIADAMTRNHEGSGLGLPLAKSLTELHGGTLKLTSAPDKGTVVRVNLPAERLVARNETGGTRK